MTLEEACKQALTILKQVMEEKLSSTNVEVSVCALFCSVRLNAIYYMLYNLYAV